ncbi:DUF7010 family protein [Guggenheimella bovis]
MELHKMKTDLILRQKMGIHFILASIIIWALILGVHLTNLPLETKNFFTFFASAPLVPISYFISRAIGVDFQSKDNPLTKLGIILSTNQMLYILIVIWAFSAHPEKMLMIYAIIFGGHLLPFSWLYNSKSYLVFSFIGSIGGFIVGLLFPPLILAIVMLVVEILFSISLTLENKTFRKKINEEKEGLQE